MKVSILVRKVALFSVLIFISLTTMALSENTQETVILHFDKPSYVIGDIAKVNAIINRRPTNLDLEYLIDGTLTIDGVSSVLSFKQFNNIFQASTIPLGEDSAIHLKVTLKNKKKIKAIDKKIENVKSEIKLLKDDYSTNPDPDLLNQIRDLEFKMKVLKTERSKNTVLVKELKQQIRINSANPEEPGPDFNTVDHPVVIENAKVYDSTVSQSARMSGSSILSGNSFIGGLTSLSGTVQVTGGCRLSSGSWSSGLISPGIEDSPCEPAKILNFKKEKLNPRTKILRAQMTLINKDKDKLLRIKNLKSRRAYAKLLTKRESIIMRMGK